MKKSIIAGAGVLSLAAAAMPFVGTFATPVSKEDTIKVTIAATCTMSGDNEAITTFETNASGGALTAKTGTKPVTVKCNNREGWSMSYAATALHDTTLASTVTETDIPFGKYDNPTTSIWSANAALSGVTTNVSLGTGWDDYTMTDATGTAMSSTGGSDAVSGVIFTPSYKMYIKANHAAGTYQGTMTYTFSQDNVPAA